MNTNPLGWFLSPTAFSILMLMEEVLENIEFQVTDFHKSKNEMWVIHKNQWNKEILILFRFTETDDGFAWQRIYEDQAPTSDTCPAEFIKYMQNVDPNPSSAVTEFRDRCLD